MGCGASAAGRKGSAGPHDPAEPVPAGRPKATAESSGGDLRELLQGLGLEAALPQLLSLGVVSPSDVVELLVEDLEGVGLTRVQIRQLQ
ncbi:unnamed protein product, partial [Polarella glacialis]